ncbi:MAG: ComF family protein [Alphaproteobacteria bacterium]
MAEVPIRSILHLARRAGRRALDLLLPPQCLACGSLVDEPGALCASCWTRIQFIVSPFCACCGLPFELDPGAEALCGACIRERPPFSRARAVMRYDDASKALILSFKHGDRTDSAPAFGRWLARAGADLLAGTEVLVPVPLHRWRLFTRRYNQAALLATELGRIGAVPVAPDVLARHRHTPPQSGNRSDRAHNVRGAFVVTRPDAVAGRAVLLIDDVFTTGATLAECARVLRAAGATRVDVLALARVISR